MQSARIHDLRINLMVNALKCRVASPDTLRQYRSLYDQRAEEMVFHGKQVEASLIDRYGPHQGRVAFDRYETRISNYHSNFLPSRERCDDTQAFIKLAARANHGELEMLSKLVTNRAINTCLVPVNGNGPGAGISGPGAIEPDRNEAIVTAPEIVDGIPTYPAPGPDAAIEPGPNPAPDVITLAEADPGPTGPTGEDKLAQAIDALDAAAAALRDMQQAGGPSTD